MRFEAGAVAAGTHVSFPLADVVPLPGEADEEVDVEGISPNGPYLCVAGSHSSTDRPTLRSTDRGFRSSR
ncbi:DUF3616 domain-containing protein [Saccharopolyspora thermophila]|uniref:DUF3616 domain-containing protein n=1 Tax=Saccharopolyspora thermophila TaxID=89367 RepID=UPI00227B1340|nr:DUF3616 domain-containing protein [Saccharopolyspora subtropica]